MVKTILKIQNKCLKYHHTIDPKKMIEFVNYVVILDVQELALNKLIIIINKKIQKYFMIKANNLLKTKKD